MPTSSDLAARPAIRVEHLGKRYRLGQAPLGHLRDHLAEMARTMARALRGHTVPADVPTLWALADVSFTIAPGEVVGVIGGNGAGKSTLLKVLSRITAPTTGRAEIRGRVGSLLEVGTGFHPDLTGRENVFLNGAILGMRRGEIARKFDAIVAFAEVDRFVDTAVKHYSSGMYVRLAFAVAAHLDRRFSSSTRCWRSATRASSKCLGKLDEVARGGRTVLFVSHNMAAVQRLCTRAIVLEGGRVAFDGEPRAAVVRDLAGDRRIRYEAATPSTHPQVTEAEIVDEHGRPNPRPRITDRVVVRMRVRLPVASAGTRLGIGVLGADGVQVFTSNLDDVGLQLPAGPATVRADVEIPPDTLLVGDYHVATCLWNELDILDLQEPALSFTTDPGASVLYQRSTTRRAWCTCRVAGRWRRIDDRGPSRTTTGRQGGPAGYLAQLDAALAGGCGAHRVLLPARAAVPRPARHDSRAPACWPSGACTVLGRRDTIARRSSACGGPAVTPGARSSATWDTVRGDGRAAVAAVEGERPDVWFAHDAPTAEAALAVRRPGQQVWLLLHNPMPLALYLVWCWGVPEASWEEVVTYPDVQAGIERERHVLASVDHLLIPCREAAGELARAAPSLGPALDRASYLLTGAAGPRPADSGQSIADRRARFGLPADRPVGLFVGNAQPYRGLDVLLAAVSSLPAGAPPGVVAVAGCPADRLPLHPRLRALGPVRAMGDLLGSVDFVINVNRFSLFDLSTIEACEAGRPLLLSATGGNLTFRELGAGCVMLPDLTPRAVAGGLVTSWATTEASRQDLSRRSRACYERHLTLAHLRQRHLDLYTASASSAQP